jgi:S-layer homology domain
MPTPTPTPTPSPGSNPFTDIGGSIFQTEISWLYNEGITAGCTPTTFCPTVSVSREQMASFLVRALHLEPSATDFFSDDEASIHEADVNALAASGISGGCGGGRFCPSQIVSREQMASFLVRAFDYGSTAIDFFTDDEASIHELDINALAASGVTGGCGGTLYCPGGPVTREQMAAFLYRAMTRGP